MINIGVFLLNNKNIVVNLVFFFNIFIKFIIKIKINLHYMGIKPDNKEFNKKLLFFFKN